MKSIWIVGMGPGIAAAVARRFGKEGFKVVGVARRAPALQEQVRLLADAGITAEGHAADAGDPAALRAVLDRLLAAEGAPDVLVYNAAGARYRPLAELSAQDFAQDLQVGVVGAFAAAQAVLPAMRQRDSGVLLFTGGGFAFEPLPAMATLGAQKAALRNVAFALHAELRDSGVHAATVTVCGMVKAGTPFEPDRIAQAYWTLYAQPRGQFDRELQFKG